MECNSSVVCTGQSLKVHQQYPVDIHLTMSAKAVCMHAYKHTQYYLYCLRHSSYTTLHCKSPFMAHLGSNGA